VPALDLALVEPDIMPAFFQVGFDAADKLFVAIVAVAEENAKRGERFGRSELVLAILANVDAMLFAEHDIFRCALGAMNGLVLHGSLDSV
jgi:hypothetical protein